MEPLELSKICSYDEYQIYLETMREEFIKRKKYEHEVISRGNCFHVLGFCYVCNRRMKFFVDRNIFLETLRNKLIPNWREQLQCPGCNLNNRMRASIQIFEQIVKAKKDHSIYILEQISPLFIWLSNNYNNVYGSEYLGNQVSFGNTTLGSIRNENVTRLTFKNRSFDFILSFDVFEHVPDYLKAIRECLRCLKPGGQLLLSVPFASNSQSNIVRAKINSQGELKFLFPPEYHGDPLNQQGSLCFHHFGWELLDELKNEGFANVSSYFYWSKVLGYLGSDQLIILGEKTV